MRRDPDWHNKTAADIRNVIVSDCIIHDSHRGIVIDGRDGDGTIENIGFCDIAIQTKLNPPVGGAKANRSTFAKCREERA